MSEAKSSAISEILRSEFSQIDDSIYQYIEGDFEPDLCFYFFCGVRFLRHHEMHVNHVLLRRLKSDNSIPTFLFHWWFRCT
jgi:hypothetical protein